MSKLSARRRRGAEFVVDVEVIGGPEFGAVALLAGDVGLLRWLP